MAARAPIGGLEWVRGEVAGAVRSLLGGSADAADSDLSAFENPPGDPGLFGPSSVAWQIGSDAAMLIGGVRALLLQTVHPLAMAGVADHSRYRSDPWGRLQRTAMYVSTTTFGSTQSAHDMVNRVTAVHRHINGVAPDGRPYSALDPELLTWVHVTEVDSFLTAVRCYGTTIVDDGAADRYHREMAVLGRLMGAVDIPESCAETEDYYDRMRPELRGSRQAREAVRFLLWPPVPARLRGTYLAVVASAVATLPRHVRDELWLPDVPGVERLFTEPTGRALSRFLGWALGESPLLAAAQRRAAAGTGVTSPSG